MRRFFGLLIVTFASFWAPVVSAFPTWMGVYGAYTRHDGGNPGVFTVMMNQDYAGLRAKVGLQYPSSSGGQVYDELDMTYKGNVNGNSLWECAIDPVKVFPSGSVVKYWFRGFQDGASNVIYDNNGGSNYAFTAKAPISPLKFRGEFGLGDGSQDLAAWISRGDVVHAVSRGTNGIFYRTLTGTDWSTPRSVDSSTNTYSSQIAINGQSIITWHSTFSSGTVFKRSLDGGSTFATLNVPVPTGVSSVFILGYGTSDYVLVYGKSELFGSTKASEVVAMVSHDNGSSWAAPVRIDSLTSDTYFASVGNLQCVQDGSSFVVVYVHDRRNERASGNGTLHVARSSDLTNWTKLALKTFEIGRTQPVLTRLAAGDGRLLIALKNSYTDMVLFRRDGANWIESSIFGTYNETAYGAHLSCGPGSLVTVVFPTTGYNSSNYSYFVSSNGGATFGPRFSRPYPATTADERDTVSGVVDVGDRLLIGVDRQPAYGVNAPRLAPVIIEAGEGIAESVSWVGNTHNWPPAGQIESNEVVWINTESWKQGSGERAAVVYSANGGAWKSVNLSYAGKHGNNDAWHAPIGMFKGGTQVRYAVAVIDSAGKYTWDSMNGQNYSFTVSYPIPVYWVGNTYNWPAAGQATASDTIWVNCESFQKGGGTSGMVVYTTNGQVWQSKPLNKAGTNGNNDWWNANLGKFAAGTTIRYAVMIDDAYGTARWDNNGGKDYVLTIK